MEGAKNEHMKIWIMESWRQLPLKIEKVETDKRFKVVKYIENKLQK